MTPAYLQLLQRPEWKIKRNAILRRDSFRCRNCQGTNGLQVHHRQYHRFKATGMFKQPWNYDNRLLITLCRECHQIGHQSYSIPVKSV